MCVAMCLVFLSTRFLTIPEFTSRVCASRLHVLIWLFHTCIFARNTMVVYLVYAISFGDILLVVAQQCTS